MKILFEACSTNGRWGLAVVGDVPEDFQFRHVGLSPF